jgi:hypothetical protein
MQTYLTLEDHIKPFLGIDETDKTQDLVLEMLNEASCEILNSLLNVQSLALTVYVDEKIDGGSNKLHMRNFPIISVEGITNGDGTTYSHEEAYEIDKNIILLNGYATGGTGYNKCKVSYTAGYITRSMADEDGLLTENMPSDLKLANLIILAGLYTAKNNIGVSSYSINGRSVNFRNDADAKKFEDIIVYHKKTE